MVSGTTLISLLTQIPWKDVIENAPKVADGATRLWKAVANRKNATAAASALPEADISAASETELIKERVAALEATVRGLDEQMQASAELIKTLAEQNSQLVLRVEQNRTALVRLRVALAAGGTAVLGFALYILLR